MYKLYIGKIQYLQEKQGFIRCTQKIEGKRDIIFFIEESNSDVIGKLKLGLKVEFKVIKGNTTNVKGGKISHWAEIVNEYKEESQSDTYNTESEQTIPSDGECSFTQMNDTPTSEINNRRFLSDLLADVYKRLHNVSLSTPERNGVCNCWQITQY